MKKVIYKLEELTIKTLEPIGENSNHNKFALL